MSEAITFTVELPVYPERVYRAWLNPAEHGKFTSGAAIIHDQVGGAFSSLGGSVTGQFISLVPHDQIHQTWQIAGIHAPESRIEISLLPTCTGTELTLRHYGIPAGGSAAQMEWWAQRYLRPMRAYFDALVGDYPTDEGDG